MSGAPRQSFMASSNLNLFGRSPLLPSGSQLGSVFFLESRIYTKRELHHVRVGNLAGGRRHAEASRRHFAHILVFVLAWARA